MKCIINRFFSRIRMSKLLTEELVSNGIISHQAPPNLYPFKILKESKLEILIIQPHGNYGECLLHSGDIGWLEILNESIDNNLQLYIHKVVQFQVLRLKIQIKSIILSQNNYRIQNTNDFQKIIKFLYLILSKLYQNPHLKISQQNKTTIVIYSFHNKKSIIYQSRYKTIYQQLIVKNSLLQINQVQNQWKSKKILYKRKNIKKITKKSKRKSSFKIKMLKLLIRMYKLNAIISLLEHLKSYHITKLKRLKQDHCVKWQAGDYGEWMQLNGDTGFRAIKIDLKERNLQLYIQIAKQHPVSQQQTQMQPIRSQKISYKNIDIKIDLSSNYFFIKIIGKIKPNIKIQIKNCSFSTDINNSDFFISNINLEIQNDNFLISKQAYSFSDQIKLNYFLKKYKLNIFLKQKFIIKFRLQQLNLRINKIGLQLSNFTDKTQFNIFFTFIRLLMKKIYQKYPISSYKHLLFIFVIASCFFTPTNSIIQQCSTNSDCPPNAFCGYRRYCICDTGYIMNCDITSQKLTANPLAVTITQSYSYFTIQPQALNQYLKFSFVVSTPQTTTQPVIFTLWGQSGLLTALTDINKLYSIQLNMGPDLNQTLDTPYFQFGLQPNGQSQVLYLGVKVDSVAPVVYQLNLSVNQTNQYNQDVFRLIVTILMSVMSISCLVLMAFCIYKRRKLRQMRQRAVQQKQIKQTDHFDQYMPVVKAQRVKIPLQLCSVCLNDISAQNLVRLTICRHLFHVQCIDSWCKKNISCPICRQDLDLQNCQKILGDGLDLTQRESIYKKQKTGHRPVQIQMVRQELNQTHQHNQSIEQGHENFSQNQNTMRRRMLD